MMSDNLFLEEISISNFRTFKKLEAKDLGRINLITGKNNSGKTTFLEALYLNLGPTNPTLWLNINSRRGLERVSPVQNTANYLYHNQETSQPIIFQVKTRYQSSHELQIHLKGPTYNQLTEIPQSVGELFDSKPVIIGEEKSGVTVELNYIPENGDSVITKAIISPEGIKLEGDRTQVYPTSIYVSTGRPIIGSEEAKRYDLLNKTDQVGSFERLLKIIEPNLVRTSLGIENEKTMVHADTGYGLVPLSLLGSGGNRLAAILLALIDASSGVLLIDEIENSFHHSILERIWLSIAEFVEMNGTQIFATTHSNECIKAAIHAFGDKEDLGFRLHRLDKKKDSSEIYTFGKDDLKMALDVGLDVR
jgi:AAA15 family ATPase/GTPase